MCWICTLFLMADAYRISNWWKRKKGKQKLCGQSSRGGGDDSEATNVSEWVRGAIWVRKTGQNDRMVRWCESAAGALKKKQNQKGLTLNLGQAKRSVRQHWEWPAPNAWPLPLDSSTGGTRRHVDFQTEFFSVAPSCGATMHDYRWQAYAFPKQIKNI